MRAKISMMPVNMTGYPVVRKTAQHAAALAELEFAMYRSLLKLLPLLPRLEVVVFVGLKAEHAADCLRRERPELMYLTCPHPSPLYVNHAQGNRQKILEVLQKVAERIRAIGL
jgi:uracil-DNA glycosylase